MGGTPLLALSIAAFPEELPTEVLGSVFAAAAEQVAAAGAILAGGHTIRDAEPKYGLAVVGTVHPEGMWPKSGARAGDALFLTKPLGTCLVLAGHGNQLVASADFVAAVEWMTTLNADAAAVLRPFAPNAVTDVTGFGLFGHAHEMAERSGVRIVLDALPALGGALDVARAGVLTGGDPRNREFAPIEADGAAEEQLAVGYDAQTAGGLLISLPADKGLSLRSEFRVRGLFLERVGSVVAGTGLALASPS
jgi:selenide,water dikinase